MLVTKSKVSNLVCFQHHMISEGSRTCRIIRSSVLIRAVCLGERVGVSCTRDAQKSESLCPCPERKHVLELHLSGAGKCGVRHIMIQIGNVDGGNSSHDTADYSKRE